MDNLDSFRMGSAPVLGVCGWSGAGKTTLIESIVTHQAAMGRKICVVKHDVHGLQLDREGKDSFRFFGAGADVMMANQHERFFRSHCGEVLSLERTIQLLAPWYDGFLIEGHKVSRLPHKIWLLHPDKSEIPQVEHGFHTVLGRDENRFEKVLEIFESMLHKNCHSETVFGGVLIGGQSRRFGAAKHLMKTGDTTWIESIVSALRCHVDQVVLIGTGDVPSSLQSLPRLADVPDSAGPAAGMRSAFRWHPSCSWVMTPCDVPYLKGDAVKWLLHQRAVGTDAVLPKLQADSPVEPLPAYYNFRCGPLFETIDSPRRVVDIARVSSPVPPADLIDSWRNINTASEFSADS